MENTQHTRILLVYSYYHHHLMVERLASIMAGYGISIESEPGQYTIMRVLIPQRLTNEE